MTERLVQCPACSRHVKSDDPACPFCGARMTGMSGTRGPAGETFQRMKAAAAVAAGVAALVACADTEVLLPSRSDDASDGGSLEPPPSGVVFYGSPGPVSDPGTVGSSSGFYGSPGIGSIEPPDASRPPPHVADGGSPEDAPVEASEGTPDGGVDASSDASADGGPADGADGA
jgi:hypothetical protein